VETNNDITNDEDSREENDRQIFDLWSEEGAQIYNEILAEGSTYTSTNIALSEDCEDYPDDEVREYRDPELYDPDEETLPPGEMKTRTSCKSPPQFDLSLKRNPVKPN
jgi:hypothetical protein